MADLDWAEQRAIFLINHYLPNKRWKFEWRRAKRTYGQCFFYDKIITLSTHFVRHSLKSEVENVILHEIAHALAGKNADHGPKWKKMCLKVGARPERCVERALGIEPKYKGKCLDCGESYWAFRKLSDMNRRYCTNKNCESKKFIRWRTNDK